ncbi:MAG TPA: hypothetical protein VGJ78_15030, partial [Vicinamibacterales bacterium]
MSSRVTAAAMLLLCGVVACGRSDQPAATPAPAAAPAPPPAQTPAVGVYVTNETGGDLSIIDAATNMVVATVPLGKRPRGIIASPDRTLLYVALSGSPIGGPNVDESKLPPPDRAADGIGIVDVATHKVLKIVKSGDDPESFDVSIDGKTVYVSNEDAGELSVVNLATGRILKRVKVGEE